MKTTLKSLKRKWLLTFVTLFIVLSISWQYQRKNPQLKTNPDGKCIKCNIMLIDIDILRADALPCYGYRRDTAPNLCSFAKRSLIFKDNYSLSRWTLPDMFSTITSLYPSFHRVNNIYDKLPENIPTLAEVLQKEGYNTAMVIDPYDSTLNRENGGFRGYDVIINPANQTVEKVVSDLNQDSDPWFIYFYVGTLGPPYLLPEGFPPIEEMAKVSGIPSTKAQYDRALNEHLKRHYDEIFTTKAIAEYGSVILSPTSDSDISVTQLFNNLASRGEYQVYLKDINAPRFNAYLESFDIKNKAALDYVRMLYDTLIKKRDMDLLPLFKELESKGVLDNTVVVIMSDHGEEFGEHGGLSHNYSSNYHSELFYTPLIIRIPNVLPSQLAQTTSNIDIFPTLLDIIGANKMEGLQGQSLLSVITNKKVKNNRLVLAETPEGIVLQNWRWLYYFPMDSKSVDQSILHDKISDPKELENVFSKYPNLVTSWYQQAHLLRSYNAYLSETKNDSQPMRLNLDPEKIKKLQQQGYF